MPTEPSSTDPKEEQKLDSSCERALEDLVRVADPSSDVRVDPVIYRACAPLITTVCSRVQPGDGAVYACLLDHLGQEAMTEGCEQRLVELQYIVSRHFTLSHQLYVACRKDAVKLCNEPSQWYKSSETTPPRGPIVFHCLYQHMTNADRVFVDNSAGVGSSPKPVTLSPPSKKCSQEIRRVLHYRASQVDLEPRIYEPCLKDLAKYCLDSREKGDEVQCLQDHLESLRKECRAAIAQFIREVDKDVSIDSILIKSCAPMIAKFCQQEMENNEGDPGETMKCLIKHKLSSDMNPKCRAGIEHHQLISLKDFRFSYRFAEACKSDIVKLCPKKTSKANVVSCLSETLRNDTLTDSQHRLTARCASELRFELLQRSENVQLDPDLAAACERDLAESCSNVSPGREGQLRCLKELQKQNLLQKGLPRVAFSR